jgi:NHLM bacteriocin system ABC transporter ATP-binding protein
MASEAFTWPPAGAIESRASFGLSDEPRMWFVRSGSVQVFAIPRVRGTEAGALRPIFEVSAGQALFGTRAADHVHIALVARCSAGSEIVVSPLEPLGAPDSGDGGLDRIALLGHWCAALSRAAAGDLLPKALEWFAGGTHVTGADQRRLISTGAPLQWLRQTSGSSRFIGRPDMRIGADAAPYPLSQHAWIELQPNSEVVIVDDVRALDEDAFRRGLLAFYTHALTCIHWNLEEADRRERQRFRARWAADVGAVQSALKELASPLTPDPAWIESSDPQLLESGLMNACRMVGRSLGVSIRPDPDMMRGRAVADPVAAIARASGLRYRRVALKDRWFTRSSEPLIAFRGEDARPAALLPRRGGGYSIYDPAHGRVQRLDAAALVTLNPFAYMFYRPFAERPLAIRDLLSFAFRGNGRDLLMIGAMSAAAGMLALFLPYLTGVVFDSLIPNARRSELETVGGLLVLAAVVTALFNVARGFAVLRLQGKLGLALEAALWDRLLALPLPFFRRFTAGDLAQRSTAFTQMRELLSGSILGAVLSGIFSVFSFGLLFYYSPRLASVATIMTLVALVFTCVAGLAQLRLQRRIFMADGRITGLIVQFISGIAKFRIAGAERRAFVLWVKEFAAEKRDDFEARRISTYAAVFNAVYVVACMAVLFFVNSGVEGWRDEAMTTGRFLAFLAAFGQFMSATLAMGSALVGMAAIVPLYERAAPILQALPEVLPDQGQPGELRGEIEAHHLVFRYDADGPAVLRDLSFHIRPGEYVAIVGPSGCGKSTLFRLLLGFEAPESGSVHYDGTDLSGFDVRGVRRQIGVVLQNGSLVAGSIWSNICGAASLPIEDAWEAARMAGLEEDIRNMPMAMHTLIQAGGGGLSGGQRQRILIARAIVSKPRLLFFDEATSALDNRTQSVVSESLKSLKATRLVIAHRLSTIREADRILVMDRGQIAQSGSYAELMARPGLFRELAERQLT